MRTVLLAVVLAAPVLAQPPTGAPPTAADSALVRQVVDAYQMERAMSQMFGRGAVPPLAREMFAVEALEDSLAARLLDDLRPALLRDALVFLDGPSAEALYAHAERFARETAQAGGDLVLEMRLQNPKKGALADEVLTRRLVDAMGVREMMPEMMRRMITEMAAAIPAMAADLEEEGGIDALLADFDRQVMADFDETMLTYSRVLYHGLDERALADAASFYESPAGRYLSRIGSQTAIDVVVPAMVRFMSSMMTAMEDIEVEGEPAEVQTVNEPPPPPAPRPLPEIFDIVEEQPVLVGGLEGLQARVEYPEDARREGVEGRVVVQFVVDQRGNVTNPVAVRSPDERLSEAAIAAVRASTFEPGLQRGRPVRVRYAVPVLFLLP